MIFDPDDARGLVDVRGIKFPEGPMTDDRDIWDQPEPPPKQQTTIPKPINKPKREGYTRKRSTKPANVNNIHRQHIRDAWSDGRIFHVWVDWLYVMPYGEAFLFGRLCNIGGMEQTDWFRCPTARVLKEMRIGKREHDRLMGGLVDKGFIRWEQRGPPPGHRHLYIEYEKVLSDIYEARALELETGVAIIPPRRKSS